MWLWADDLGVDALGLFCLWCWGMGCSNLHGFWSLSDVEPTLSLQGW